MDCGLIGLILAQVLPERPESWLCGQSGRTDSHPQCCQNEDLRRWKWLGNAVSFVDPRTHISTFRASPVALLRSLASLVAVAKSPVRATCIWFLIRVVTPPPAVMASGC